MEGKLIMKTKTVNQALDWQNVQMKKKPIDFTFSNGKWYSTSLYIKLLSADKEHSRDYTTDLVNWNIATSSLTAQISK